MYKESTQIILIHGKDFCKKYTVRLHPSHSCVPSATSNLFCRCMSWWDEVVETTEINLLIFLKKTV